MSRAALIWSWSLAAGGGLVIAAQLIRSAIEGTLLLFHASEDGPSWATVGVAVLTTVSGARLWQHYRERPKAEGGAL